MDELDVIYAAIAASGFSKETLQKIDDLTNDILYGRKDFNGFTLSEHAGLCKGGSPLIGAAIVVSYARRSLTTGGDAESSEGQSIEIGSPCIFRYQIKPHKNHSFLPISMKNSRMLHPYSNNFTHKRFFLCT